VTTEFRAANLGALALWLAIAAVVLFIRMLPLDLSLWGWPGPDLLLLLTLGWVLRRPAQLPAAAIGIVWLIEDLLTMRPPGLWALLVLAGTEFLRARHAVVREINLGLEWVMVAGVIAAMWLANRTVLAIVVVPNEPLDLSLARLAATLMLYPVAVFVLHVLLGVRKPATGELDELGRRL
jgi:rod shape-determining protein MreD